MTLLSIVTDVWMPHGMCWSWNPWLLWSIVLSHAITGLSYYAISVAIVIMLRSLAQQLQSALPRQIYPIGALFVVFVSACGTGHFVDILTVWVPLYGITAVVQGATAIVSLAAALYFPALSRGAIAKTAASEQTELELRQQAQEYQLFFDNAHVSIFCKQENKEHPEDGAIMLWYNEELCRQFDITKEQWVGQTDLQFLANEEGAKAIAANDREVFRRGYMQVYEEASAVPGGMPGTYFCSKFAYKDPATGLRRLGGIAVDVTGLKMTQAALKRANEELNDTLEELNDKNEKIAAISQMSGALSACQTFEEIQQVVRATGATLFDRTISGDLCMLANSKDYVENRFYWGNDRTSAHSFAPSDCWALRLNQPHTMPLDADRGFACQHLVKPVKGCHLCLPLGSRGESISTLGVLHAYSEEELNESQRNILKAMAEQLSIAISGLVSRRELSEAALRDPLLGLHNRRFLNEMLPMTIAAAQRDDSSIGVIMLDVDNFKRWNDVHGHLAGDAVLVQIANALKSNVRGSSAVARWGGEELIVILPGIAMAALVAKAEQLRQAIEQINFVYEGETLSSVTASFGVSLYPEHGDSSEAIVKAADKALRVSKSEGKNRVTVATT